MERCPHTCVTYARKVDETIGSSRVKSGIGFVIGLNI